MKIALISLIPLLASAVAGQQNQTQPAPEPYLPPSIAAPPASAPSPTSAAPSTDYVLGPFDQITLVVGDLPEDFTSDKVFRIDGNGDVSLPFVGQLHAGGLTRGALEEQIKKRLSPILKNPDVIVNVTEFASQTVSVLGAVKMPGMHQLLGQKTVFEMLSASQGLADNAGTTVKITREARWGTIPLPAATVDTAGQVSVATVRLKDIARSGSENIIVMPGDTIFVPKADLIYAVGSVVKPGGFIIGEKETLSALQVVSLAEGLQKTAAGDKAKILRSVPGNPDRVEIAVNIKKLMAGKTPDIPLQADDILFIPNSGAKSAGYRTVDAIVNAASGLAILGSRM
jgi:polysaccharide export outer membrane protein